MYWEQQRLTFSKMIITKQVTENEWSGNQKLPQAITEKQFVTLTYGTNISLASCGFR